MKNAETASFWAFSTFALTYTAGQLGLPRELILNGVLLGALAEFITIPIFGALFDRVGRRPVWIGGSVFLLLFAFPFFWLIDTGSAAQVWLALVSALRARARGAGWTSGGIFSPSFSGHVFATAVCPWEFSLLRRLRAASRHS